MSIGYLGLALNVAGRFSITMDDDCEEFPTLPARAATIIPRHQHTTSRLNGLEREQVCHKSTCFSNIYLFITADAVTTLLNMVSNTLADIKIQHLKRKKV